MPAPWPFQSITAPNFLSGIFAWTQTSTRPPGLASDTTPIRVKSIWVMNTGNTQQTISVTDGNGVAIVPATATVEPGEIKQLPALALESYTGIKVASSVNSGVQGQVEGWV